jgi:hypothetical protein
MTIKRGLYDIRAKNMLSSETMEKKAETKRDILIKD